MTKQAKNPAQKPEPMTPDMSAMTAMMMTNTSASAKAWTEMMTEMTRFVSERLQNDVETQKAMLRCQTPADLMHLQSEFFRKTVEQYTGEAQRLFAIMTEATEGAVKDTKTGTKRGYDDVPL